LKHLGNVASWRATCDEPPPDQAKPAWHGPALRQRPTDLQGRRQGIPIAGGREVRAHFVNCFTYAERGLSYQAPRATGIGGRRMDAILNFLSRATGRNVDIETVETTIIFCGIGLLVLLLFLTYGLDLSPEFI
jgi:hypothetical protein